MVNRENKVKQNFYMNLLNLIKNKNYCLKKINMYKFHKNNWYENLLNLKLT